MLKCILYYQNIVKTEYRTTNLFVSYVEVRSTYHNKYKELCANLVIRCVKTR